MSADNWAVCPRCWDNAQRDAAEHKRAVMSLYGQIPVEEFDAKRDTLTEPDRETYCTFREDYEIGADGGEVVASYRGQCTVCALSCEFGHAKRFWSAP